MVSNRWIVAIGAVVILIVGGAIGWAIGANTGGDHAMNHGSMAMDQKEFLAMMVAHHRGAVDMAEAEIEAGSDPKVKALAQRVITAQKREIAQMTSWYRALYGEDVPPIDEQDLEMGAMMGMSGMSPEAITGAANPDQAFLRMMIPHHAGALIMADMVLNGTPNADVKKLAETIIADQSMEIAQMQEMRTAS